jgi:hypothetical protein
VAELIRSDEAETVAVYAVLVYGITSAVCSSPQTTELNAHARAQTLMKWVTLALIQAALFTALGVALDKRRWPPALGGGLAMAMLWVQYVHARNSGLASDDAGTETY